MEYIMLLLLWVLMSAGIGYAIGDLRGKENGGIGAVLGGVLGPVGWIVTALLPGADDERNKGSDAELVRIAKLEAELAALKSRAIAKPEVKRKSGTDLSGDGGIPTYKLD